MKVKINPDGVDIAAEDLGPLLDLDPSEVPVKMKAAEITSLFETGEGEDADRCRLTFWHRHRRVRLICDPDGTVLKRSRDDTAR